MTNPEPEDGDSPRDTSEETDPDSAGGEHEEPLQWVTEDRENAYSCPGFSIVHEEVTLPDGTTTDFDYLHDGPSVVILPFTPHGDLVLIEEWRQAVKQVTRGFPAGGIEPGEGFHQAAQRELTEETGYETSDVYRLDTFEPATGISDAVFHYFVATDCRPTGTQNLDEDESIRVVTSSLGDILETLFQGDLKDGRTALGLLRYVVGDMDQISVSPPNGP
ncbi:NUDIX hydrolase [Halodesulfurarchaeum sp.]|uniref:NUDIX hydrolase n=1 Tax=Halodesulfurarchaeum sp. TaxID=1980530 RepID=UPI001BBEB220|nr:NUDIX hydrolase [Halodesulfurarchaeum sp.]